MNIKIIYGDITTLEVDAIVNAAKKSLCGGGGVDGAIHWAAGEELVKECLTLGGCETGDAKITKGYALPAKYVIHTNGPIYYKPEWAKSHNYNQAELLSNCYKSSLNLAKQYKCKSIAFPSISCGVRGYPYKEACEIALNSVKEWLNENNYDIEIIFCAYEKEIYQAYLNLNI